MAQKNHVLRAWLSSYFTRQSSLCGEIKYGLVGPRSNQSQNCQALGRDIVELLWHRLPRVNRRLWLGGVMDQNSATTIEDFGVTYLGAVTSPLGTGTEARYPGAVTKTSESGLALTLMHRLPVLPAASVARSINLVLKRALDIVLSGSALLAMSLVLIATAIAVKVTSRGPTLFVQMRPGLNGVMFPMLKFRTMYADLGDASGVKQTVANDPRITSIGAFLRRTSLDELPQLINVLLGHMSLVGPRPHPANMLAAGMDYRDLVPYYEMRYAMKPGLSGWAQANGLRGPTDEAGKARARIAHDMAYIQNFSVLLDIKIIFRTIIREFVAGTGS